MAVTIVGKQRKSIPEQASTTSQEDLADIGLAPEVKAPAPKAVVEEKAVPLNIFIGSMVRVNHNKFPWITVYKQGDEGVVKAIHTCKDNSVGNPIAYDILDVEINGKVVLLNRWEVDVL